MWKSSVCKTLDDEEYIAGGLNVKEKGGGQNGSDTVDHRVVAEKELSQAIISIRKESSPL